jgi:hypothetical protein
MRKAQLPLLLSQQPAAAAWSEGLSVHLFSGLFMGSESNAACCVARMHKFASSVHVALHYCLQCGVAECLVLAGA